MNYKADDIVTVHSLEWLKEHATLCKIDNGNKKSAKDWYYQNSENISNWVMTEAMLELCGKKFKVNSVNKEKGAEGGYYILENVSCYWQDWMLEDPAEKRYRKLRGLYAGV